MVPRLRLVGRVEATAPRGAVGEPRGCSRGEQGRVKRPSKIVCVGRNYREHAAELGNPVPERPLLFLKPPSAVIGHGDTILLPPEAQRVEHEGEIAVVIRLVAHISHVMTLEEGDVVATGTPSGVGPLRHGDVVEVDVTGVGVLRNDVRR